MSTVKLDLPNADLTSHFVETTIAASTYSARHSRLWAVKGVSLKSQN